MTEKSARTSGVFEIPNLDCAIERTTAKQVFCDKLKTPDTFVVAVERQLERPIEQIPNFDSAIETARGQSILVNCETKHPILNEQM